MSLALQDRLLRRELGNKSRYSAVKGIYGDRSWIDDLDIVNELGGHSGCVNALRQVNFGRPSNRKGPVLIVPLQLVIIRKTSGIGQR